MQLIKVTYTNGEEHVYNNFTDALFGVMLMKGILELREISYKNKGMNIISSVKLLAKLAKAELLMKLKRIDFILEEGD